MGLGDFVGGVARFVENLGVIDDAPSPCHQRVVDSVDEHQGAARLKCRACPILHGSQAVLAAVDSDDDDTFLAHASALFVPDMTRPPMVFSSMATPTSESASRHVTGA